MAVVSVAGAAFTVTIGATAYTDQVTSGSISTDPNIVRTVTLGGVAFNQTDLNTTIGLEFLYDENTGMYDALQTAAAAGSSLAVTIESALGAWTGTAMYVETVDVNVDATGVATCSVSFTGNVTFA